jgi:hypothetical protein
VTGVVWMERHATAAALDDHGVVTMAMVESKRVDTRRVRTKDGTRTATDYLVTYAFEAVTTAGGKLVGCTIEHEVSRSVFDGLTSGQPAEIRYLPEDPARADFFPGDSVATARVLGWLMPTIAVSLLMVLGFTPAVARRGQPRPVATGPIQSL